MKKNSKNNIGAPDSVSTIPSISKNKSRKNNKPVKAEKIPYTKKPRKTKANTITELKTTNLNIVSDSKNTNPIIIPDLKDTKAKKKKIKKFLQKL